MTKHLSSSPCIAVAISLAVLTGWSGCGPGQEDANERVAISAGVLPAEGDLELEVSGGDYLSLDFDVPASWYVKILAEPVGIRVDLGMVAPDGERTSLGPARSDGPTPVSAIGVSPGTYQLELYFPEEPDVSGSIRVWIEEARRRAETDPDRVQAERLFFQAESLRLEYEEGASRQAIEQYGAALSIWDRIEDPPEATLAIQRIGTTYWCLGSFDEAIGAYEEALSRSIDAQRPLLESRVYSDLGLSLAWMSEIAHAQEYCQSALALAQTEGGMKEEARALTCLAEVAYYSGNLEQSLAFYGESESLWHSVQDRWGQANALLLQGTVYSDMSDFQRARASYEDALALARALQNKRIEAQSLYSLARLLNRTGDYQEALNRYNEAAGFVQRMGDRVWEGGILTGIASIYDKMAEPENAILYLESALEIFAAAGIPVFVADVSMSIGEVYLVMGDHDSALDRFQESLAMTEELDNQRLRSYALRFMGLAHLSAGEPGHALEYYQRALDARLPDEDPRFEAYILGDMGKSYQLMGEYERAFEYFGRALALSRTASDRYGEAAGLFSLASAKSSNGELEAAREYVERSLEVAESLRAEVASQSMRASFLASVQKHYELQIEILMRMHDDRPGENLAAIAFKASERARARSLLESLAEAEVDVRAGAATDLLDRESSLMETLADRHERQMQLSDGPEEEAEATALGEEIRALTNQYDQVRAEIRSQSPRYAALTQPQPLSLQEVQVQILDDETMLLEYSLGEQRSFLWAVSNREYYTYELPPRQEIEAAAQGIHELLTARLPSEGESIGDYRRRVRDAEARYWEEAAKLSEILLAPVAERIAGKRLLVVSDGALQYLPFTALPEPSYGRLAGRADAAGDFDSSPGTPVDPVPLILEHEIISLPSASALAVSRAETAGRTVPDRSVAVLADPVFESDDPRLGRPGVAAKSQDQRREKAVSSGPDPEGGTSRGAGTEPISGSDLLRPLRDFGVSRQGGQSITRLMSTRREAEAILAAAPPGTSFSATDFAASRATAMDPLLGQYRIVHFATHGLIDNEHPGLSVVILSMFDENGEGQDGFLRLHDIYNLELPVELVVLSACNSALGKQVKGEGLVGLVRGFMYAGSKRVVASLWKVEDAATAELMTRFYQKMLVENQTPAAALRQAQIALWSETQWKSPFFWAAFVLQGEWM